MQHILVFRCGNLAHTLYAGLFNVMANHHTITNYCILKSKETGEIFWTRVVEVDSDKYEILFIGSADECKNHWLFKKRNTNQHFG